LERLPLHTVHMQNDSLVKNWRAFLSLKPNDSF
jgi:hypothetical protein